MRIVFEGVLYSRAGSKDKDKDKDSVYLRNIHKYIKTISFVGIPIKQ